MQRGEGMAPAIDVHDDANKREWATFLDARAAPEARASIDNRRRRSRRLSRASRLRDKMARDAGNGNSNSNNNNGSNSGSSNNNNNNSNKNSDTTARKESSNDSSSSLGAGGGKSGFRNSGDNNDDNNNNNSNGNSNSSNSSKSNGNGNSKGSGNGNSSSGTTATTATSSRSSNDSNGAQKFSPVLVEPSVVAETTTTTVAATVAAITSPATIVVTSTVIAGPQKDSILTNYIPLVTAAPVEAGVTTQSQLVGAIVTTAPSFSTLVTSVSSASASASASKDSGKKHGSKGSNNTHKSSKSDLSPGAADALISTGSIGSFILVCFLVWLVWRGLRKRKQCKLAAVGELGRNADRPLAGASKLPAKMYERIAGKIPFLDRRRKAWQSLEDAKTADRGQREKDGSAVVGLPSTIAPTATYNEKSLVGNGLFFPQPNGLGIVGQDNTAGFGGGGAPMYYAGSSLGLDAQPQYQQHQLQQLQLQLLQQQQLQQQQQQLRAGGGVSVGLDGMPTAAFMQHQHTASYSSSNNTAAYFANAVGGGGASGGSTMPNTTASNDSDTLRSRMPDPFYNQSQLARQPSDAYDPTQRQVNRLSELSSLSSGFGDEDMIMAVQQQPVQQRPVPQPSVQVPSSPHLLLPPPPPPAAALGRFSWKRVTTRMSRDTVYTEASDDQPARFRSVTSWVNQQTGRVRRAQQHEQLEENSMKTASSADKERRKELAASGTATPGIVHPMPEEPQLRMMADDGQEPRRPETVPAIQLA